MSEVLKRNWVNNRDEAGTWRPLYDSDGNVISATIVCPNCSQYGTLQDHEIGNQGEVRPSVECPGGCGFHEDVVLDDWPPEEEHEHDE